MLNYSVDKDAVYKDIASGNLNPKILNKLFADMQIRSYTYDYQIQKELVNYHEERFTSNELKKEIGVDTFTEGTSESVLYFPMKHQLIATGKRKAWRDSDVYGKAMTFDEVNANHKLFKFNVLVFFGNELYTNIRIKPNEEFTNIYFRYRDIAKIIQRKNIDITVLCIPQSVVTVVNNIEEHQYNKGYFSFKLFDKKSLFELQQTSQFIGFLVNKSNNRYIMADSIEIDSENKLFKFNHPNLPKDITNFKLILVGSNLFYTVADLPADNDQFFSTDLENMPIPKDNISILVKGSDGLWLPNQGSVKLTEKYPNVYKVDNPEDYELRLVIYYADNPQNSHIVYDTEMDYYLNKINLLDAYQNGYVPALLNDYTPPKWDYNLKNYFNSNQGVNDTNIKEPWTSFSYKLNTISSLIKQWCGFYLEYAKRTYGFLTGWYHDISKWSPEHLASKERMDSFTDIPRDPSGREEYPQAEFKEPQYVFTYKNSDTYDDPNSFLFYVDGRMVIPTAILVFRGYQYVYLPKKRIKPDSMIEVERFDGVKFSKRLRVPEEGVLLDLNFLKGELIADSMFIVNSKKEFANKNYKVEVIDPDLGETYTLDLDTSVYILNPKMTLKITPLFEKYYDSLITLQCNNQLIRYKKWNTGDDYARGIPVNFNPDNQIINVKQNISPRLRIYTEDGRFLSKRAYLVQKRTLASDKPKFSFPIRPGEDRTHLIAYIGYDERLIYRLDTIPNNGFIDIEGKTSRPICLSYHDIYLNGIKLHKNDIKIISPFKFAITTLSKHNTLDNLEIYEKAYSDDSMYKFEIDEDSMYLADKLFHEDDNFRKKIIEELDEIDPDGTVEDIQFIRDWYKDLLDRWVFNNELNADTRYDLEFFAPLFDRHYGYRFLMNADDRVKYKVNDENKFYLWHDGSLKEAGTKPIKRTDIFSDLEGVTPTDITMSEAEYISSGGTTGIGHSVYDYTTEKNTVPITPTYHFPSDLDSKDNLIRLNPTIDSIRVTKGESYKREGYIAKGTRGTIDKVSPTSLDSKPSDVIIEAIDPEYVRMPSRIATPEPTLPKPGEYTKLEEDNTSVVSYGLSGEKLAGLSVSVVRREFGSYPVKELSFGEEYTTVRYMGLVLKYHPIVELAKDKIITIKVLNENKKIIYYYEINPGEDVNIDQYIKINSARLDVIVETKVDDTMYLNLYFDSVDYKYSDRLVVINAKTNDIVKRITDPSGIITIKAKQSDVFKLMVDYDPIKAKEFDTRMHYDHAHGAARYFTTNKRDENTRWFHNEIRLDINGKINLIPAKLLKWSPNYEDYNTDKFQYDPDTAFKHVIDMELYPGTDYHIKSIVLSTFRVNNRFDGKIFPGFNVEIGELFNIPVELLDVEFFNDGESILKFQTNGRYSGDFTGLTEEEIQNQLRLLREGSLFFNINRIEDRAVVLGNRVYFPPKYKHITVSIRLRNRVPLKDISSYNIGIYRSIGDNQAVESAVFMANSDYTYKYQWELKDYYTNFKVKVNGVIRAMLETIPTKPGLELIPLPDIK